MSVTNQSTVKQALGEALKSFPPIADLEYHVYSALGAAGAAFADIVGFHTFVSPSRVVVYLMSLNSLGIFEADENGQIVVLTVNASRIRRVVRTEDTVKTNLTIELEAGQYQSVADATGNVSTLPAGYELGETNEAGRQSLRLFQLAISRVLSN